MVSDNTDTIRTEGHSIDTNYIAGAGACQALDANDCAVRTRTGINRSRRFYEQSDREILSGRRRGLGAKHV
jgi:hypothetical protein